MNILLVDDEKAFLVSLKKAILNISGSRHIDVNITMTTDPYAVTENELYRHCDVILLDIEMPHISGIEISAHINALKGVSDKPYIVFITNRDGLVFDALKTQPYSFVRKSHLEDLQPCLLSICDKLNREETYLIKSGRAFDNINIKELVCLEKQKNYVVFHTEQGDYRERTTIDEKAADLLPHGFLRPHIGYLVNMKYIDELLPQTIRLTDGTQIPLSKKYRREVKQRFYEWMVKTR